MAVLRNIERRDTRGVQSSDDLDKLRDSALRERCALTTERLVGEILQSSVPVVQRVPAILDVALGRDDFPYIQVRALSELLYLSPEHARKLIEHILRQPIDEDRDHVRARAYATLVQIPAKTETDVRTLLYGLTEKSRAVQSAIAIAIRDLYGDTLRELQLLVDQADPSSAGRKKLKGLLELSAPTERDFQRPRSRDARQARKEEGKKCAPQRALNKQPVRPVDTPQEQKDGGRRGRSPRSSARSEPQPPLIQLPPVVASVPQPDAPMLSNQSTKAHPRMADFEKHAPESLEEMRDPSYRKMTWRELLTQRDALTDPSMLCACFAEMIERFGARLARDEVATRLVWVMSHSEPELKSKAGILLRRLF